MSLVLVLLPDLLFILSSPNKFESPLELYPNFDLPDSCKVP